ncbi:hypothetical protein FIBSPDRAFT_881410 [Athelia psychrophila]|uniref:Uncharacterized protein n=1 Tax=Athelia psychrophila TaxID=1759441 RepID=A0A166WN21_9AGAM|nr:hypothetical protein FIBSPDRAFT_881410 [Fibularhizoctonia sp. CBS 109695]
MEKSCQVLRIKLPKVALQFLQQELTKLETFIDNEVLLGISLQSLSISCKIKNAIDDGDLETDGCESSSEPWQKLAQIVDQFTVQAHVWGYLASNSRSYSTLLNEAIWIAATTVILDTPVRLAQDPTGAMSFTLAPADHHMYKNLQSGFKMFTISMKVWSKSVKSDEAEGE